MKLLHRLGARFLRLSVAVDKGYRLFDRIRGRAVLAVANEGLLDAYNNIAYGRTTEYRADSEWFRKQLFRWEEEVIRRVFPAAPARLLVGGAGGGREALALADQGYTVVAFDPSPVLVQTFASAGPTPTAILGLVGRYEDLPTLRDIHDRPAPPLTEVPPFDAAILGWSSFSHLRSNGARVAALRAMGALSAGPLLVSFFSTESGRHGDRFSMSIGFYHSFDAAEIEAVAAEAGMTVVELSLDIRDGRWPYAVLQKHT